MTLRPKRINYELINKLAGYGPYGCEKPTRANMERLANPATPLSERIRLLQAIAGGPLWEGVSWLMIFGLIVATLLTLVIVPALYAIFVENFGMKPVQSERE